MTAADMSVPSARGKRDEPWGMKRDCVLRCLCRSSLRTETLTLANLLHCSVYDEVRVCVVCGHWLGIL